MGIAFGGSRGGFFGEYEAHAGYAFQALAGSGDQRFEGDFAGVDRQRTERAHGVDDQALAVAFDHPGDLGQRVEDAGAGFAVDQRDMGNARVGGQQAVDVGGSGRLVLGGFEGAVGAAQYLADLCQALAISAVDQHQHLAVLRHQGTDSRFHGEGAAALQGHAVVAGAAVDDRQQLLADTGSQLVEVAVPEPQSTSMAWRVRIDVVRGPGVSRIGALLIPLFLTSGGLKLRGLGCNSRLYQSNCLLLSEL